MGATTHNIIVLPALLDLFAVDEFVAKLQEGGADLPESLDISGIEKITSAGVQLLLVLLRQAEKMEKSLQLQGQNEVVAKAFSELGLEPPMPFSQ